MPGNKCLLFWRWSAYIDYVLTANSTACFITYCFRNKFKS